MGDVALVGCNVSKFNRVVNSLDSQKLRDLDATHQRKKEAAGEYQECKYTFTMLLQQ